MATQWKVYVYVRGYVDINGQGNIIMFHAANESAADAEVTAIKAATNFHTIDNTDIEVTHIAAVQKVLVEI